MTTKTAKTDTSGKKDVSKLQRVIVDGLEDVKAQDIVVFDTERISALFERVIIASGTSNRQTKALAASVRDAVREAGFQKPRSEGEENGEWIIVDCGAVVVHIMQPAIRQYYHLEELWGETPVRLKFGATQPVIAKAAVAKLAKKAPAKKMVGKDGKKLSPQKIKNAAFEARIAPERPVTVKAGAKKTGSAVKTAAKPAVKTAVKSAAKPAVKAPAKTAVKPAFKTAAKSVAKPATKSAAKTVAKPAVKAAAKTTAKPAVKRATKRA
jgi:ribosome-associated protein